MAIMAKNDDLTEIIESILKIYFKIKVVKWYDGTSFYGSINGKNRDFTIEYGANVNAKYKFHYMDEPFHIIVKKPKKN